MKLSGKPCACGARGVLKDSKYRAIQKGFTYDMRMFNCARCQTSRVRIIEGSRRPPPPPPPEPLITYASLEEPCISQELFDEIMADLAKNATGEEAA